MNLILGERSIQAIGDSLYVCLPAMWVKTQGAAKGSIVRIEMLDSGELRMSLAAAKGAAKAEATRPEASKEPEGDAEDDYERRKRLILGR